MSQRLATRLLRDGARSLSDSELVAVLLHSSCRSISAKRLADDLLNKLGGIAGLSEVDDQVLEQPDIGTARAAILLAARKLAARFGRAKLRERQILNQPAAEVDGVCQAAIGLPTTIVQDMAAGILCSSAFWTASSCRPSWKVRPVPVSCLPASIHRMSKL